MLAIDPNFLGPVVLAFSLRRRLFYPQRNTPPSSSLSPSLWHHRCVRVQGKLAAEPKEPEPEPEKKPGTKSDRILAVTEQLTGVPQQPPPAKTKLARAASVTVGMSPVALASMFHVLPNVTVACLCTRSRYAACSRRCDKVCNTGSNGLCDRPSRPRKQGGARCCTQAEQGNSSTSGDTQGRETLCTGLFKCSRLSPVSLSCPLVNVRIPQAPETPDEDEAHDAYMGAMQDGREVEGGVPSLPTSASTRSSQRPTPHPTSREPSVPVASAQPRAPGMSAAADVADGLDVLQSIYNQTYEAEPSQAKTDAPLDTPQNRGDGSKTKGGCTVM